MNRYLLRRLALIPLVLIAVNFFGFAYAYLVQPGQLARNPFLAVMAEPAPVLPAYFEYIKGLSHGDLGALPPAGAPIGPVVFEATIASLGLLAVALLLSVLVGLGMGVAAVRTPGRHGRFGGRVNPAPLGDLCSFLSYAKCVLQWPKIEPPSRCSQGRETYERAHPGVP